MKRLHIAVWEMYWRCMEEWKQLTSMKQHSYLLLTNPPNFQPGSPSTAHANFSHRCKKQEIEVIKQMRLPNSKNILTLLTNTRFSSTPLRSTLQMSTSLMLTPSTSTSFTLTPLRSKPPTSTPLTSTPLTLTPLTSTLMSTPLMSTSLTSTPDCFYLSSPLLFENALLKS